MAAKKLAEVPTTSRRGEAPRRKSFRLHQSKIDDAMEVLGTSTETETVERALELVVFRDALVKGVREMRGAGLADVMEDRSRV